MAAPTVASFDQAAALAELRAMREEIGNAADGILNGAESILSRLDDQLMGDSQIRDACCAIMIGCAFRDLVGQRISKLEGWLSGDRQAFDTLLNGPAVLGAGLDQAAADALFMQSSADVTPG